MDFYTKYIILNHLYWMENNISQKKICQSYKEVKSWDVFSNVYMNQIQKNLNYILKVKETITTEDYNRIKYLYLNFSRLKLELHFVKNCINLEEINISCYDETNLNALIENTKLKKVIANSNQITDISALSKHWDLEHINITDNQCIDLKPIIHLKKIKKLEVGLINNEEDALSILKNNTICEVKYIISLKSEYFENFNPVYFQIIVYKKSNQIEIDIEGVENTSSYPTETVIPDYILKDKEILNSIYIKMKLEITNRLEVILGDSMKFINDNSYSFNPYHINYVLKQEL